MQVIIWRTGQKSPILLITGALISALLAHVCCWGPALLVPLGLGGVSVFLKNMGDSLKPWDTFIPALMMLGAGWRIYRKSNSQSIEKVVFWFSAVLVVTLVNM